MIVDCGSCHNPHYPDTTTDPHDWSTASNLKLIRMDTTKYIPGAEEPAIYQENPGDYSFDTAPYNGICQSCHTNTTYHSNSGIGTDHQIATACTTCHQHENGFLHGGGGTDCTDCHSDSGSHATHLGGNNRGPATAILCTNCHVEGLYPLFENGVILSETTVCDPCHSPNGTYDGVEDPIIGAKTNWTVGVYTGDALTTGKEKWCVTCHDDSPSVINTTSAPDIAGDESGSFLYGTGYGYYKTGHGLETTKSYPDSGGIQFGAGVECDDCHDFSLPHIDGDGRTFDCGELVPGNECDSDEYKSSYRLDDVLGANPMEMPKLSGGISTSSFALCFNCHNPVNYQDDGNNSSNFRNATVSPNNLHNRHLSVTHSQHFRADWKTITEMSDNNSRITCVACHNVHGTKNLSMMRDGRLIGATTSLKLYYYNNIVVFGWPSPPPTPNNITLLDSTGYVWSKTSVYEYCRGCHGGNPWMSYERDQGPNWNTDNPALSWTQETNYLDKGVYPKNIGTTQPVEFRIEYIDKQNDAPSVIQIWIDQNDDGDYDDAGEMTDMTEVDGGDVDYTDGKFYTSTHTIYYPVTATDGMINYRFYTTDGINTGIGTPTEENFIRIDLNNAHDVPSEYSTIQAAIDDTDIDGMTTVLVADGTYTENINFGGRAITVISVSGYSVTAIDGNATGTVVTFNSGEGSGSVLDGFTIQNGGSVTYGGGIYLTGSSPVIKNCNIFNNNATHGPGIYMISSSPTIDTCLFSNNTSVFDGAIYAVSSSRPTISNCTFTGNQVRWGGGIFIADTAGTATFTNLIMTGNNANSGAGLYIRNSTVNVTDLNISSNTGAIGGGIHIEGSSVVTIDGSCNISNNSIAFDGGGINITGSSTLNITGCTIEGNSGRWGGGFRIISSEVNITGSSILNNSATFGGGINSIGTSTVTITNSLIVGNTALAGGGITTEGTTLNLMNSTIANNSSTSHGSAIDVNTSNTITITNAIFDGNSTSVTVNEIQGADSILDMDYSIYSTTLDSVGTDNIGLNMVSTPPFFVDGAGGNYYLLFGSSGIDTGTSLGAPADDIVGTSRGLDGDNSGTGTGDGSDYDMGVFEHIYVP